MIASRVATRAATVGRRRMSGLKDVFENKNGVHDIRNKYFLRHTEGKIHALATMRTLAHRTRAS
jgi:hypothetical protein